MLIKYRPHRGSLSESMAHSKEFDSVLELKQYIVNDALKCCGRIMFMPDDIIIGRAEIDDDRVGWKSCRYVCITKFGGTVHEHPYCIGICTIDGSDPQKAY